MSTANDIIIRVINETKRSTVYLVKRNEIEVVRKDLKVSNVNIDQINQEMDMLKRLRDRSVVIYKESFYDQKSGLYHIYMEYFEEGDLYSRIVQHSEENKDFKEEEIVSFCKCMCNSLKYIHSSCIIHRNIKPQNIYIDDSSIYVLGDFGICMMSDLRESKMVGTENYMAPELWDKDYPIYTPATDVFAFGCILYEIYTLRSAFPGRDINEIRNQIFDSKLPSFHRHNQPRIPQIEVLITKMLEKNPLSRINLESIEKQFNPWVNVMNSSTISIPLPTQEEKDEEPILLPPPSQQQQQQQQVKQKTQLSSSSDDDDDDSVECSVYKLSRNKSMLSKSAIKTTIDQIDNFDGDKEDDEPPVRSLLLSSINSNNDNNESYTFVKRGRRVGALYLSLGSLSGEKIVQFYLNERDLNGKLISDYLKMNQKEIDAFDFMEYLPFYFPLLDQQAPKFGSNEKEKFNESKTIKENYEKMMDLVLRKYGEVNSSKTHFYAKETWKDSKELEEILIHIHSSFKSIYGKNNDNDYFKMIKGFFNENHIEFIYGVKDSEKTFNEANEEIDPYTGEKKNSLTVIDFYTNVIPVGGYKITDICELKMSIMNEFPLQHFVPWLFPELYQQNPRFDPFDKSSMKYIKKDWINYSYCIMNKILNENNINFDYEHKQVQVVGTYILSDELKLYILKMIDFLRLMSEDENASSLEEFLHENGSNGRVIGLAKPIHPSQIEQPLPLPLRKNSPTTPPKQLPPLPVNRILHHSPPSPPPPPPPPQQQQQVNHNQYNNNHPQLPPLPLQPQFPPASYPAGPPQPRGFNQPPPLPPKQYSDVVRFYLGEIKIRELNIDYFLNSPLELLVDFDFIDHINYFAPVKNQKYPKFTDYDINMMRRIDIKSKYEVICSKIMERYNFVYFENGRYILMNQKIENKEIRDMLYQIRESIKEIYNDESLIKNIEFCLGLNGNKKRKEGHCIIQ